MPSPKRWMPVSRDLNDDPEVWEFTDVFGDRSLRVLIESLACLDRSENRWRLTGRWLGSLSRKVRQHPATVQRAISWMIEKGWLAVEEQDANGSPLVLSARNYWKFHKWREPQEAQSPSVSESTGRPMKPPSFPNQNLLSRTKPNVVEKTHNAQQEALENFSLTEELQAWAQNEFGLQIPQDTLDEFKGYWRGQAKLNSDWDAAFKSRIRALVSKGVLKPDASSWKKEWVGVQG